MVRTYPSFILGKLCTVTDGAHAKVKRQPTGVPYLTSGNIGVGVLKLDKVNFISEEEYSRLFPIESMRRLKPGDILVGIIGTFGNVYRYRRTDNFGVSSAVGIIRPDPALLDSNFLYYVVTSESFKNNHLSIRGGSVQGYTNIPTVKSISIPLPPLPIQRRIAAILGRLDDKIEVNRRINRTLEAMAQALYQHWFVDFGPFQEGEFVESSLGLIPAGWRSTTLQEITTKIGSGATPHGGSNVYIDEGINLIRSQNVYDSSFSWDGLAYITDEAAEKLRTVTVAAGDILINITGDSILRTCVADEAVLPARVNQHVAIIRTIAEVPPHFVHQHLLRRETKEMLFNMSAGATRKAITKGNLESTPILRPPDTVLDAFRCKIDPFFAQIAVNNRESRKLAEIRDYLLPKLLAGEIGVVADVAGEFS